MVDQFKDSVRFSRYPAIRIALVLSLGIIAGRFINLDAKLLISIFFGVVFLQFLLDQKNRKWLKIDITRLSTLLFTISIILFGSVLIHLSKSNSLSEVENLLQVSAWEEVNVEGVVQKEWENSSEKLRADIEVIRIEIGELNIRQNVRARLLFDEVKNVQQGDTIEFSATIIPIPGKRNPFQFDYQKFLSDQDINTQLRLDSLVSQSKNTKRTSWNWWRLKVLHLVEANFSTETAPIAKALLLGHKQDLEGTTKQAFARAGLSHIMAVSGLHVGFIVAPFWMIIPFFWSKKFGRFLGLAALILVLFIYAGLTGFSTSVMRASIMAILLTIGKLFNKAPNSINLTGAAAIVILIMDPSQLFEIGFQLSFSAVFVILLILPVIQRGLPYWLRIKWYAIPLMTILVSFIVQLGLYPLQVYYFGEVSLIGPFANALFVPLLGIVVPLSLVCLLISSVFPILGFWVNVPSGWFLQLMSEFVIFTSQQNWVWIEMDLQSLLFFPLWASLIFFIASWRLTNLKWKWLITSLSIILVIQVEGIVQNLKPKELVVTVFDVGQGDASLIETPNGKTVLIDAGNHRLFILPLGS